MTARHWAHERERGNLAMMRITAWLAQRVSRRAIQPLIGMIVLYFYLFGGRARRSIARYQARLTAWSARPALFAQTMPVYRQYLAFAQTLLDKLDVWQGRITLDDITMHDPDELHRQMGTGRGQLLVGAHLGNLEICRALADRHRAVIMNVLVHNKHAEQFNQVLKESGAQGLRLFQVSELDAGTMLALHERLERGEWLAIAGDRVPLHGTRTVEVDFLGARAPLPQGPWLLGGLLHCPVNTLFCVKQAGRYHVTMARLADEVIWKRSTRNAVIAHWAQRYADRLASACVAAPTQWFNFFPFWSDDA